MTLFLIWDSESEVDKDCTILQSSMAVADDDVANHPRKRARPAADEDEDSSGSVSGDSDCEDGFESSISFFWGRVMAFLFEPI